MGNLGIMLGCYVIIRLRIKGGCGVKPPPKEGGGGVKPLPIKGPGAKPQLRINEGFD